MAALSSFIVHCEGSSEHFYRPEAVPYEFGWKVAQGVVHSCFCASYDGI